MADLRIELLGGFRVTVGDRVVPDEAWHRRKPAALVKLLALAPAHRLHREQLMEALWPDLDPAAAGANLRKALHHARRAIDADDLFASDADVLRLAGDALWVDVAAFRSAVALARRTGDMDEYRRAVGLYRDGLLPDDRYEPWADDPRDELRAEFLAVLAELAGWLEATGDVNGAIDVVRRRVDADPLDEEGATTLIRLNALAGRRTEALREYDRLRRVLDEELAAEPSPETQRLYEEIRTHQVLDPELNAALWERVGDLRMLAGDVAGAVRAFDTALDAGGKPADIARLHRKCAEVSLMRHRPADADAHLATAEASPGDDAERGRVLRVRANHAWETGDIEAARSFAERSLDAALAHGTPDDVAAGHEALAIVSHFRGEWRAGLTAELQRLAGTGDDLGRVFDIHHCIGQYHLYGDGLGSVEEYARQLLDRAEDAGAVRAQAFAWCLLGEALLLGARFDESAGCLERSCDLHASMGSRSGALAWQRRGELAVCRGAYDEVDGYLRQASAIATVSVMARHLWGRIHATQAFSAVEQGDPERAARAVRAAAAAACRYGECPTCSALLNPMAAETYALLHDTENAGTYAASAAGVAAAFASPAWQAMAESAAASAARAQGDDETARARADAAARLFESAGQPYWAARSAPGNGEGTPRS